MTGWPRKRVPSGRIFITEKSHIFHKICRSSTKYVVHPKIIAFFAFFSHNENKKRRLAGK
jgi:hypothetical protein